MLYILWCGFVYVFKFFPRPSLEFIAIKYYKAK